MLSANPFSCRFTAAAIILVMTATFAPAMGGQEPPAVQVGDKRITGLPSDWSHRHVIYGDPGTEQNAVSNGTHEQWDRVVHDPRYIIQRLKKDLPVRGPAAQDVEMRHRIGEQERWGRDGWGDRGDRDGRDGREGRRRHHNKPPDPTLVTMHRDWSMKTGGSAASIVLTIPAASSSVTTFTIVAGGTGTIAASAPTAQTGTLNFGTPGSGTQLVFGGVTYNFSSANVATPGTANTCNVVRTGASTTTSQNNLLGAMTNGASGATANTARFLCNATMTGQLFSVTSFVNTGGTHTINISATINGSTGIGTPTFPTGIAWAGGSPTNGTDGTSNGTNFTYWNGNTYDTAAQLATSLAASINANVNVNGNVTATANSPSSGQLTIAADAVGTGGNGYSVTTTTFFTGGTFAGGAAAGNLPGVFPAKFSVSTASSVNCSNAAQPDYVVYPTGAAGSASSATIIAYDNIYATSCTGVVPTVYWAYNTGTGSAVTSPILSYDGTQVAFMETPSSGGAVLRIVKFAAGAGTDSSAPFSFTPATDSFTNGIAGAGGNTAWTSCPAGSCMISVAFQTAANPDTNSSPFYDFDNDILYVGDDSGKLHKFTGVFKGTPGEVTTNWPVTLGAGKLTSPVIDPASGSIFVGSSDGILYRVTTPLAVPGTVLSGQVAAVGSKGIVDSPIVDSTSATPVVYVFVGDDGGGTIRSAVVQFATNFGATTTGSKVTVGASTSGSTTLTVYDGDFDNTHYTGTGSTGNLYFCGGTSGTPANPTLYKIGLNATFSSSTVTTADALTSGAATCSPATEFYNAGSGASTLTTLGINLTAGVGTNLNSFTGITATATSVGVFSRTGIAVNDYILVGAEYMLVTGGTGTGGGNLTVTRGQLGSTAVTHAFFDAVTQETPGLSASATSVAIASSGGIQNGDYISVGSEIMDVTGGGGTNTLTVTRGALGSTAAVHANGAGVTVPALDWLFLGVTANGGDAVCTSATGCLYGFYIGGATPTTATNGLPAVGGTSGIIIDNGFTADGASQVYYTTLSPQACTGNGTEGIGTGGCAIQASQSGLN